jgi:hypothetical protein
VICVATTLCDGSETVVTTVIGHFATVTNRLYMFVCFSHMRLELVAEVATIINCPSIFFATIETVANLFLLLKIILKYVII